MKNADTVLAKDICMKIAAAKPEFVDRNSVPADRVEKEMEILKAQAMNEGKPAEIAEKMVNGRLEKFYKEICLLEQPFIKDPDVTVEDLLKSKIATIGENITIRRFARFEKGEGLEKKEENFAEEVMKQING
jgi:elongation factor Ts